MNIEQCIFELRSKHNVLDVINCSDYNLSLEDLYVRILKNHKKEFQYNERIVFCFTEDWPNDTSTCGIMMQSVQAILNDIDISNFFVCFLTTNQSASAEYDWILKNISTDPVPVQLCICNGDFKLLKESKKLPYIKATKINDIENLSDLSNHEKELLFATENFCILPWIALMIDTDSTVKVCCESTDVIGDCSQQDLKDIWNSKKIIDIRNNMLQNNKINGCQSCHIKESLGRDTLRKSSNSKFLKHIKSVHSAPLENDDNFKLRYLDARFSNLCNLACRSCNPNASSSWHEPAVHLGMIPTVAKPLLIAGKKHTGIYNQLKAQSDNLEKIYFAGGEPMIIEEFYDLLHELDKKGRHDIELVYNTNLTKHSFKQRSIFEAWENFSNISVGASLDGELERGEYLRTGCKWEDVIEFRSLMLQKRPDIDFYISAVCSIINALHLPDFHKSWVDKGLISPADFNVALLFEPDYMRVDSAPAVLKKQIIEKYTAHLEWLRPRDSLGRATYGFQSVLSMINNDIQFDAEKFWRETNALDRFHGQNLLSTFPELRLLPQP